MATPTLGATPGPISGMPAFTGTLSGLELIPIVVPPFGVVGSNQALPIVTLATAILGAFAPVNSNSFFGGPASGAAATPAFRTLVLADIPGGTSGFPLVGNNATTAPSYQLLAVPGGGIGTAALPADGVVLANGTNAFSVVGATTAGLVLTSQGSTSPPVWSGTSGGTITNIATGTGLTGGPITSNGTLSLVIPVTVPNGGIGTTALPTDGVVLGNGSSPLSVAGATTAGYPFVSNGSTSAPSFQVLNLAAGTFVSGVLPLANGGIGTSALPLDGVVLGNSPALKVAPATTAGYPLVSNGSTSAPGFALLTVAGGGIGTSALPLDGVVLGNATALTVAPATTAGFPLVSNGSTSAPSFQTIAAPGVGLLATSNTLVTTAALNNATTYVTGPSVAQGTVGTWFVMGSIAVQSLTTTAQNFVSKLWDGTNVVAQSEVSVTGNTLAGVMTLSGFIAGPASNLNIAAAALAGTGSILGSYSNITAIRIA